MKNFLVNGKPFSFRNPSARMEALLDAFLKSPDGSLGFPEIIAACYPEYSSARPTKRAETTVYQNARKTVSRTRKELNEQLPGYFMVWLPLSQKFRFYVSEQTPTRIWRKS